MKTPGFQALVLGLPVCRPGIPSFSGKHMTVIKYHQQLQRLFCFLFDMHL